MLRSPPRLFFGIVLVGASCNTADDLGRLAQAVDDPQGYGERVEHECAEGIATSCTSHGIHFAYGTMGRPHDVAVAVPILQKGCDLGDPEGCKEVAVMYEHGRGVDVDLSRAYELYVSACTRGAGLACTYAGDFHRFGRGRAKDEAAATGWYAKACAAGIEMSCEAPQ